jgi:epoxyqueuosine reductase
VLTNTISETEKTKNYARELGADLVGVADISALKSIPLYIPNLHDLFPRAISIAVSIEKFGSSHQEINFSYVNQIELLESIALKLSLFLEDEGFRTLVVHPRDHLDHVGEMGLISNKAVAKAAGIGWLGKSLLLVTSQYGPRVRLVSVFTDMPLVTDAPLQSRCGTCQICIAACPEKALKNVGFVDHPKNREEVLEVEKCKGSKCLVCVLVCPIGNRKKKRQS